MTKKDYTKIIGVNTNSIPAQNPRESKDSKAEIQYQENSLLQRAIHFRDFEIEMSWKRATYFTLFLSAIFVAYYTIKSNSEMCVAQYISTYGLNNAVLICKNTNIMTKFLSIILPALGTIISWIWYLVNRGSKQTYENWEHHIDCIENKYQKGVLYSEKIYKKFPSFVPLVDSFPISASKANNLVSFVITLVFGGCFFIEICNALKLRVVSCICLLVVILVITIILASSVWWLTSGDYTEFRNKIQNNNEQSDKSNDVTFRFYNRLTKEPHVYIYKRGDTQKDK